MCLRLKFLPFKMIKFKFNLVDNWYNNFTMDTFFSKSKYLDEISLEKKINDDVANLSPKQSALKTQLIKNLEIFYLTII